MRLLAVEACAEIAALLPPADKEALVMPTLRGESGMGINRNLQTFTEFISITL